MFYSIKNLYPPPISFASEAVRVSVAPTVVCLLNKPDLYEKAPPPRLDIPGANGVNPL